MKSTMFMFLTVGLALTLAAGCATSGGNSGSSSSANSEPQVKAVISPTFAPQQIPRIAIVSTKITRGKKQYESQDDRNRGYGYESDAQAERNAHLANLASVIEDAFTQALIEKGYSYAARTEINAILKEQSFQHSGLTDSDAASIGKLLNVPAVLVISASDIGTANAGSGSLLAFPVELAAALVVPSGYNTHCSMTARLLSTQTGEVLWLGKLKDVYLKQKTEDYAPVVQKAAELLANSFPPRTQ